MCIKVWKQQLGVVLVFMFIYQASRVDASHRRLSWRGTMDVGTAHRAASHTQDLFIYAKHFADVCDEFASALYAAVKYSSREPEGH